METKLNYLLDTCILIDFLRGDASIYDILVKDQNVNLSMSTVTMMELMLDALIAATLITMGIELVTHNKSTNPAAERTGYGCFGKVSVSGSTPFITPQRGGVWTLRRQSDFKYIPNILLHK